MHTSDNQTLIDALGELSGASSEQLGACMRAVLEAMVDSWLITGNDEGDLSVVRGQHGRGHSCLALFTTKLDLHFFDPGCPSIDMRGADAVRRVSAGDFDGLVINPGAQQFELSREDVLDYFEVDDV